MKWCIFSVRQVAKVCLSDIRLTSASVSVFLVLVLVIVIAWYSTYVVEPVVQSVILVERSPMSGTSSGQETEITSSTVDEVRQAVTQFLQQQQLETQPGPGETDTEAELGPELEPEQVSRSRVGGEHVFSNISLGKCY